MKKIHQKHRTAEYNFSLLLTEMKIFQEKYPKAKIDELKHKFYKTKKDYLKLYPSVMETLIILKAQGCKIVAYTESQAFHTNDRIRKLGLDGIIEKVYSSGQHEMPDDFEMYYEKDYYLLKKSEHIVLAHGHKKPDSTILNEIIAEYNYSKDEILYIGDSLIKDISMAKDIGIIDVHAAYGSSHNKVEYELLKKVTHWTDAEVKKESETTTKHIVPTYVLKASFSELLDKFDFNKDCEKDLEHLIKLWDRTIDVQKHFNDIELKIRQLVITVSGLLLGGIITFSKLSTSADSNLISIAFLVTAVIWMIFYFVDKLWYHPLLKGAVYSGLELEKRISEKLNVKGLTHHIGEKSPIPNPFRCKSSIDEGKSIFSKKQLHSDDKMNIFYVGIISILLIAFVLTFI